MTVHLSTSVQAVRRWWGGEVVAFVITQHAGPSEETETVEGCQVQDKQPATEKKRKVECAGLILSGYMILVFCFKKKKKKKKKRKKEEEKNQTLFSAFDHFLD